MMSHCSLFQEILEWKIMSLKFTQMSQSRIYICHFREIRTDSISPPIDAKMNENGQLVWVDESGNVYCQNPDGTILSFNQLLVLGAYKLELN